MAGTLLNRSLPNLRADVPTSHCLAPTYAQMFQLLAAWRQLTRRCSNFSLLDANFSADVPTSRRLTPVAALSRGVSVDAGQSYSSAATLCQLKRGWAVRLIAQVLDLNEFGLGSNFGG